MAGKASSERDKKMAAYMKDHNITRTTGRCSVCYRIVSNGIGHIMACKGPSPR